MSVKKSSTMHNKIPRFYNPTTVNQKPKNNLAAITKPYIIRSRYKHENEFQLVNINIASRKTTVINFTKKELENSYDLINKLITTTDKIIKDVKNSNFNVADLSWVTNPLADIAAEYDSEQYSFIHSFIADVSAYCNLIKQDYNYKYKLFDFLSSFRNDLSSLLQQHKKHTINLKSTPFILKIIYNTINFFSSYIQKNALFKAIANKDNAKVEKLLEDIDINTVKNGQTLLMCALSNNNIEVVDKLIQNGIDINTYYHNGNSILMEAINEGKNEFAKKLIHYGADLNAKTSLGDSALIRAFITDKLDIASYLIEHGADINIVDARGSSALMLALIYDQPDAAKGLIELGADINIVDAQGNSALMLALMYDQPDIAKRLIELGADINLKNNNKNSPLTIATKKGYENIIKILMDTGNITNDNRTKAITLIKNPDKDNLIKTLSRPAISRKTTPVMLAIKTDANLELIKYYIKLSPETINATDASGNTALMIALQFEKKDVAELLISLGADVLITNNQGYNALNIVQAKGNIEDNEDKEKEKASKEYQEANKSIENRLKYITEYCNTFGVDSIDVKDEDGNTPLMRMLLSTSGPEVESADIIIKLGADVTLTNNKGQSTLDIAIRHSSKKIIDSIVNIIKNK